LFLEYPVQVAVENVSKSSVKEEHYNVGLGAAYTNEGVHFLVWAPNPAQVELHITAPENRLIAMEDLGAGYYSAHVPRLRPGTQYFYRLDGGRDRPDPASRYQPEGVHGPSEVVAPVAVPRPRWNVPALRDYIIYELHVGTFTAEGTLDAIIPCLPRLQNLGITALELMPLAEFPGARNWGYDGVCPYAVHSSYGGPAALRRLVDACHARRMAVVLDVVYNHLGPEGNYLREFGPYFTDRYRTPWGDAINFDGAMSDPVRRYFIENALYWIRDCGVDALRLDAVHAIYDLSAYPFLQELQDAVQAVAREQGRRVYLIAESDLNDSRLIRPCKHGGLGLDAQWSDDFHHSLHTLLTREQAGYYADFGSTEHLAEALRQGWTYGGQYSTSRARRFGNSPSGLAAEQFVVCAQNHDQVGNRMRGERLCHLVDWERAKLAAAAVLLSPCTPLLFMGEEYADPAPFLYHVSHSDEALQRAVRVGRRAEFCDFLDGSEPPDPHDECTFYRSKLNQHLAEQGRHARMQQMYAKLIAIRQSHPAFRCKTMCSQVRCYPGHEAVEYTLSGGPCRLHIALNFGDRAFPREQEGEEQVLFRTSDHRWGEFEDQSSKAESGPVQPFSAVVFGFCSH